MRVLVRQLVDFAYPDIPVRISARCWEGKCYSRIVKRIVTRATDRLKATGAGSHRGGRQQLIRSISKIKRNAVNLVITGSGKAVIELEISNQ